MANGIMVKNSMVISDGRRMVDAQPLGSAHRVVQAVEHGLGTLSEYPSPHLDVFHEGGDFGTVSDYPRPRLDAFHEVCVAQTALVTGNWEQGVERQFDLHTTRAAVAIAEGDYDEALLNLDRLEELLAEFGRPSDVEGVSDCSAVLVDGEIVEILPECHDTDPCEVYITSWGAGTVWCAHHHPSVESAEVCVGAWHSLTEGDRRRGPSPYVMTLAEWQGGGCDNPSCKGNFDCRCDFCPGPGWE